MYVPVLHRDLVSLVSALSTSGSIKQHFGFSELLVSAYFKLTSEQHPNKSQTFPFFNSPARLVSITEAHHTKTIIQAGVIPLTELAWNCVLHSLLGLSACQPKTTSECQ